MVEGRGASPASTNNVEIRVASEADAPHLALLKVSWSHPNDPDFIPDPAVAREFAPALAQWMRERGEQSLAILARVDGQPVGMAWLAIFHRVPNVGDLERRSGDVQSVLVLPRFRGRGIGRAMMQALVDEADRRGIREVFVSSSTMARRTYEGVGFRASPRLLQRPLGGGAD
jgi:GNAT superfamily N-acetyltransferase